jgi:NAD-dependent dihydropyrimidine dehydrogenase PreA subunit
MHVRIMSGTSPSEEKKFKEWFGVDRKKIPWYPKIDPGVCVGCGLCAVVCGRGVYSYDFVSKRPVVVNPYNCLVGCTTCANLCPTGAIEFPSVEVVRDVIRKYKVFLKVKEALVNKFKGKLVEVAREYLEEQKYESERFSEIGRSEVEAKDKP